MNMEHLFTRQERLALGFLLGMACLGMGVQVFRRGGPETSFASVQKTVSINRAAEADLVALPGIGPVLAKRILQDRKLHGRYLTLTDLRRVKGITPKTLRRLERLLRFD